MMPYRQDLNGFVLFFDIKNIFRVYLLVKNHTGLSESLGLGGFRAAYTGIEA